LEQKQKRCKECNFKFNVTLNECPECGTEFTSFRLEPGDKLIYDSKKLKIAVRFSKLGMTLRTSISPDTYHNNWSTVLIHLKRLHISENKINMRGIAAIAQAEKEAIEWAKGLIVKARYEQGKGGD